MVDNNLFYPADFVSEGVDQTRGWFFALHAISTMIKKSVAFKAVISCGLVLDKNGNKMSKHLGNAIDPFGQVEKFGSDRCAGICSPILRLGTIWYDEDGVEEVKRKFFGTLYNTYSFFALYANVDGFRPLAGRGAGKQTPGDRPMDSFIAQFSYQGGGF